MTSPRKPTDISALTHADVDDVLEQLRVARNALLALDHYLNEEPSAGSVYLIVDAALTRLGYPNRDWRESKRVTEGIDWRDPESMP